MVSPVRKVEKMDLADKTPEAIGEPLKGINVLVVEDDDVSAKYLDRILSKAGAEYRILESFAKMKEYCSLDICPNVVLLDIALVGANGFDCLRWLRKRFSERVVVYIAQTAHVFPDEVLSYAEAGFDDFIGKPYNKNELINVILVNL